METNIALKKVLVVDDTAESRDYIVMIIQKFLGHAVEVLSTINGAEALHIIKDHLASEPIGLVVSDVQMPVLDGVGLARVLKESGVVVPIIFTSGLTTPENVRRLEKYSPHFIPKPSTPSVYIDTIKNILSL